MCDVYKRHIERTLSATDDHSGKNRTLMEFCVLAD